MADSENGERIRRMLDQGLPFEDIFPRKLWTPPVADPYADGHLDFVAADQHIAQRPVRSYVATCKHGSVELTLPDKTADEDGEVLDVMLRSLRARSGCSCWPKGWKRVEVGIA